jgi:murein DD-endopeptidase MepM/ murein hydrolase activator NlpD
MKRLVLLPLLFILLIGCKTGKGIFGSKSLHEQYGQKLKDAGLQATALGNQWFAAAERALQSPQTITLPYKEMGYFPADKARATGLRFSGRRGEKLLFSIDKNPAATFTLYVELWRVNEGRQPSLISSLDSTKTSFEQEVDRDESYILRLQPELLESGDYTLSISIGPSLGFPVPGGRIGSVWGDERDAGARSHEGIDIFAPKRTPAIAAAEGTVSSVREGGLGGKVVFMRPSGKDYTLYYAHLDEQLVQNGQRVKVGDTLGLVGNTGNARTTPPHLHFGIYAIGGAINPFPFVNPTVKTPTNVNASKERLINPLRATTSIRTESRAFNSNAVVYPLAVTTKTFRVEMPDGTVAEVPSSALQPAINSLRQVKLKGDSFLLESPSPMSARKKQLKSAATVKVLGYFGNYAFVEAEAESGWIPTSLL